ncbi:MAG: ribonuclease P protein component [Epsilonproteobacteria bacterium]|nr:MAG: ribonuclease P protein component [Campylobacterota bacterium]RLA64638.1 MAG: ribonuclease P protein component [Campylobacterota bacterium]
MTSFSYGKNLRLLSASDFQYLRNENSIVKSKCLRIYFKPSRLDQKETRIGLSVSKKVGPAVTRNRTKRILKEVFRLEGPRELGLDLMVVVSPFLYRNFEKAEDAENSLRGSFKKLLKEISSKNDRKVIYSTN